MNLTTIGVTMSSLEIAGLTGKKHPHVLRDIDKMLKDLGEDRSKFGSMYLDGYGREQSCYNLPQRECLILVSGYSTQMRAKIIDRWQELELAMRREGDGVVTDLSTEVRRAIGGITKGVIHNEIAAVLPEMIQSELASRRHALVIDTMTAGQVLDMEKVPQKGRRGLVQKTASRLRKYCERNNIVPRQQELGNSARAYVYSVDIVHRWLKEEGRALIRAHLSENAAQATFKLVYAA
jgi:hypothetical protein